MTNSDTKTRRPLKFILTLLGHQFIGTLDALLLGSMLATTAFDFPNPWAHTVTRYELFRALTGFAPYFPIHVIVALLLGWILADLFGHQSMRWIWVGPYAWLVFAFTRLPTVLGLSIQERLSHFFGHGCHLENYCADQLLVTLPFYAAVAYSIGAEVQQRIPIRSPTKRTKVSGIVLAVGIIMLADLVVAIASNHAYFFGLWQRQRLAFLAMLVLLAGVDVSLIIVALKIRRIHHDPDTPRFA